METSLCKWLMSPHNFELSFCPGKTLQGVDKMFSLMQKQINISAVLTYSCHFVILRICAKSASRLFLFNILFLCLKSRTSAMASDQNFILEKRTNAIPSSGTANLSRSIILYYLTKRGRVLVFKHYKFNPQFFLRGLQFWHDENCERTF